MGSERIDVPREMANCVRQLGGTVLDEVLVNPNFKNADYWFSEAAVVAELKCMTEDLATDAEFNSKATQLHKSWVERGLVAKPSASRARFNLRDIPPECAYEFIEPIKRRLESSVLKKANRQIRETKKYLKSPFAKGLLLLVNDGNFLMPPSVVNHLLGRCLKGQYSSINSVIYLSVNQFATMPGLDMPALFWIDALVPGRMPVDEMFRLKLQSGWMDHHASLVRDPVLRVHPPSEPDVVDGIQFLRPSAS
jgi:hypothetical protein